MNAKEIKIILFHDDAGVPRINVTILPYKLQGPMLGDTPKSIEDKVAEYESAIDLVTTEIRDFTNL